MDEYINKQQILEKSKKHLNNPFAASLIIAEIEKADGVEVKQGEWIEHEVMFYDGEFQSEYPMKGYKCSLCGRVEWNEEPYCHCGAKMDERSGIYNERKS